MFKRKEVIEILRLAQDIDSKYERFGASTHQYRLNPPIEKSFVYEIEERYGFLLPEDYVEFITEIGDGGAGPYYGINPFRNFCLKAQSLGTEKFREAYRHSLALPFIPRQMLENEVEDYAIVRKEIYEQNPENYFIYEKTDENALCDTDGFLVLGTHGCQWDFGLIITGAKKGQVFDTDNEGAYGFVSSSFVEFYQNWLKQISDFKQFEEEMKKQRLCKKTISQKWRNYE